MKHAREMAMVGAIVLVAAACAGGAATGDPVASGDALLDPSSTTTIATDVDRPELPGPGGGPMPPDVDLTMHSVPLEEVYFDTFDGNSVPLSESTRELRERLLDAIPPIDAPAYGDVTAGDWLLSDDLVLGYVAGDQAYAYPFKILNFHEIVNDELDGLPVLISYCPLCRSGVVYDRRVEGRTLSFGNTSALYESDLVMVDRATGSYWWQVAGVAIVGPLTGTRLDPLPSVVATWADWKSQYPTTLILTRDTGYVRPYASDSFATYEEFLDSGQFPFPVGEASRDGRLDASALVVGVELNGVVRAYPIESLTRPISDDVGGEPIVVFPVEGGASVFGAELGGETLTFQHRDGEFVDVESGSVWVATGAAISGARKGAVLEPIPSRTTFWFAFVGAFPDVEVYRG